MSNCAEKSRLEFHRYDFAAMLMMAAYAASSVAVPIVLVQLARSLNFPLDEGGMSAGGALQISRSFAIVVLLALSGFIAGRFGKRRTIGFSILLMASGIFIASISQSYIVLLAAMLIAGLGEGPIEGMGTPFVQDLHPVDTGRYMNITHGFWSVGVFLTVICAGGAVAAGVSWRIILLTVSIIAMLPCVLMLLPEKKGHEYPESKEKLDVKTVSRQTLEIMKVRRFWLFFGAIFLGGGAEYCLTFWTASFIQLSAGGSALTGGLATAVFAAAMAIGRVGGGIVIRQKYMYHFLLGACVLGIAAGIPVPFLPGLSSGGRIAMLAMLFGSLFLLGLAAAPLWPTIQTYAVDRLSKKLDSTMIYVLLSCAGVPGCGFFTFLTGVFSDWTGSLAMSFLLVPGCFLFCGLLLLLERCLYKKQNELEKS